MTTCLAGDISDRLSILENKVFGHTHLERTQQQRLQELEENTFGQVGSGSVEQRISKLEKVFYVPSKEIPSEFEQRAKQQVQASPETSSPSHRISKVDLQPNLEQLSEKMINIINKERSLHRRSSLSKDPIAYQVALEQASYLVQTQQLSHYGLRGENPDQRYRRFQGQGKIAEMVDGFFAEYDPVTGEPSPIDIDLNELPHQLMDALLESPDKNDILFAKEANKLAVSFVLNPDRTQLAVVIEIISDHLAIEGLPLSSPRTEAQVRASLGGGYRFAWIGVAKKDISQQADRIESEASPYFPPIDQVVYIDGTKSKAKTVAQAGGIIVGVALAPWTGGASMLFANVVMAQMASTYQMNDVQVRKGVNADRDGSFVASIPLGEQGPGLYYVSIWAKHKNASREDKPVAISRLVVDVK